MRTNVRRCESVPLLIGELIDGVPQKQLGIVNRFFLFKNYILFQHYACRRSYEENMPYLHNCNLGIIFKADTK